MALLGTVAGTARAQDGVPGTARTIDGRTLAGAMQVDEAGAVRITTAAGDVVLTLGELTGFDRTGAVVAPVEAAHRVWLRSGLELPATRLGGSAGAAGVPATIAVHLPSGVDCAVPLGSVRAIRHGLHTIAEPQLFATDFATPPGSEDLIYVVKDGKAQRSAVVVKALTSERIQFSLRGDPYEFPLAGLAGVVFGATTGFAPDRQPKPRTRAQLTTGELLEGRLVGLSARTVRLSLDEGVVLDVPSDKLASLQIATDRLAWLSELAPKGIEQTPAFDRTWPWSNERTPAGPGFVLGGKLYRRGLCLIPRTRLTWDLGGKFDVFEATVGIDDRGGPEAHALFRVLVDDRVVWESAPRTRGQPPEEVRLDLQRGKQLALEVDFGKNYDLGDHCVFADARLVQK